MSDLSDLPNSVWKMALEYVDIYYGPIRLVCLRFLRLMRERKYLVFDERFFKRGIYMMNGVCVESVKTLRVVILSYEGKCDFSRVSLMCGLTEICFVGCDFGICCEVLKCVRVNLLLVRFEECKINNMDEDMLDKLGKIRCVELVKCWSDRGNMGKIIGSELKGYQHDRNMCCSVRIWTEDDGRRIEWDYLELKNVIDFEDTYQMGCNGFAFEFVDFRTINFDWMKWTNLLKISLRFCEMSQEKFEELGNLIHIRELELECCELNKLNFVEKMKDLIIFKLIRCDGVKNNKEFERIGLLGGLKELQLVYLKGLKNIDFIENLGELETLIIKSDLNKCLGRYRKLKGLEKIKQCKKLRRLDLIDGRLDVNIVTAFCTLELKSLDLSGCIIEDLATFDIINELLRLTSLERLSVSKCGWFDNDGLRKITQSMEKLRYLNFSFSSVCCVSCLDNLRELEELVTDAEIEQYDVLKGFGRLRKWRVMDGHRGLCNELSELFTFVNIL